MKSEAGSKSSYENSVENVETNNLSNSVPLSLSSDKIAKKQSSDQACSGCVIS